eukprot:TRINITY_DN14030_c0_g1_i4.p1 TRINITY_DN14030_c0_g1~~TRINITY_DN14030_c0_g1_i4.p1  ORF type:complete len:290 (+),score=64.85 TRINITY_DN14030_c0_g1_i4:43-912(+)
MSKVIASAAVKNIGVIGAGQMGNGIAQVAASAGFNVILSDVNQKGLDLGKATIEKSLSRFVKKGVFDDAKATEIASKIDYKIGLKEFGDVDVAIEAAPESEALKNSIFSELDAVTPEHCMLASNTSSISITRIAAATKRPEQVIGMHFMNPPPLMKLIEVINGMATCEQTFKTCTELCDVMGKTVAVSQDRPGFIANRILMPMINEAFYALMEGVGEAKDIDTAMKLGTNQPMGPLTLADFIGLDTCLAIMRVLNNGLGDSKYRPCPLLVQYVDAGWLGRKTGKGVYEY